MRFKPIRKYRGNPSYIDFISRQTIQYTNRKNNLKYTNYTRFLPYTKLITNLSSEAIVDAKNNYLATSRIKNSKVRFGTIMGNTLQYTPNAQYL
jgi:hypothetical protein